MTILLAAVVVLVAWLQFQWLTRLSEEEEARRRFALDVAATNLADHVSRRLNLLVARAREAASVSDLLADDALLGALVAFDPDGGSRIMSRERPGWTPATRAELQQLLGRPLTAFLRKGRAGTGLWLKPPVLVICRTTCQAGVLSRSGLAEHLIEPAAKRVFADFADDVAVLVSIDSNGTEAAIYPPGARLRSFEVTDLTENLLPGVDVLGPPNTEWLVKVNHAGSSLEAAVARSHLQNLLLSAGVMLLLAVSIGLVISNVRRQSDLARERLYFVAAVSHELRTPLTVISTAAENLADATIDDAERTKKYGQLIHGEVRKLGTMIENVLQFAQSASSTRPRTWSTIRIADLIADVVDNNRALLANHELRLDIPEAVPPVGGDASALQSVFANLLGNAARYSEGGDWIDIRVRCVRVRPRGRALRVSISNPVGRIEPDPERFFEPFYRGANARKRGVTGTGIGLAVARQVAKQHGGGLRVQASRDGVITFTLLLPIDESATPTDSSG